jgi:branched-subunit amino acid aminotransferase/4-amino-4-deoxychorismate lyase
MKLKEIMKTLRSLEHQIDRLQRNQERLQAENKRLREQQPDETLIIRGKQATVVRRVRPERPDA